MAAECPTTSTPPSGIDASGTGKQRKGETTQRGRMAGTEQGSMGNRPFESGDQTNLPKPHRLQHANRAPTNQAS
eukprot:5258222-Pyramimonas_sp.AAC.1